MNSNMKKFLFLILGILATSFAFTACSDDDDNDNPINAVTPESTAAGIYEGSFSRVIHGTTDTTTATGTMQITADSAYCADFTFVCTSFNVDRTSVANISYADNGFVFSNLYAGNPLGAAWAGRIDNDGIAVVKFFLKQVSNRRTVQYDYTFTGRKATSN